MTAPQWRMPAEFAPQRRVWMAWPSSGYVLGENPQEAEETRTAWAAVANAIAEYEELVMVIDPEARDIARRYLSESIMTIEEPLNDAWMRDFGPTFVLGADGELGAVDWRFNGWGAQEWARWDRDELIGAAVAGHADATLITSPLVNEGGGINVDGKGTVLATLAVQLDPGRNPGITTAEVEAEFARTIGATKTIWVPRGLYRDAMPPGTRGHIDIVATFTESGHVVVHDQPDPAHPDHEIMREITAILERSTDATGAPLDVVRLAGPTVLKDDEDEFVDYSYINHVVINGAVIIPAFGDPRDEEAAALLADLYPGREMRLVESRPIFRQGGGIHCITQQEPLSGADGVGGVAGG